MINSVLMVMVIATIATLLYILQLSRFTKAYGYIFDGLSDQEHPLKCVYPLGYGILECIHFDFDGNYAKRIKRDIGIVLGKKYADFYLRVNLSGKAGTALLVIPITLILYGLLQNAVVIVLFILLEFLAFYYFQMQISDVMKKRDMEISRDLPSIISKITLLVNAGMVLREAWAQVAQTGDTTLYKEMQRAVEDMNNGMSEVDAYMDFSQRCQSAKVRKFISTVEQNVSKGNKDLVAYLKEQSQIAWTEKKEYVRQQGETASSKMLIPIGIMFVGILIMVIVPIFANFSF